MLDTQPADSIVRARVGTADTRALRWVQTTTKLTLTTRSRPPTFHPGSCRTKIFPASSQRRSSGRSSRAKHARCYALLHELRRRDLRRATHAACGEGCVFRDRVSERVLSGAYIGTPQDAGTGRPGRLLAVIRRPIAPVRASNERRACARSSVCRRLLAPTRARAAATESQRSGASGFSGLAAPGSSVAMKYRRSACWCAGSPLPAGT